MNLIPLSWMTGNQDGQPTGLSIITSTATPVSAIGGQEEGGYGIVNCYVSSSAGNCGYCCMNFNGEAVSTGVNAPVASFHVREQGGYGVVNFGVLLSGQPAVQWVFNNQSGDELISAIPPGTTFAGFQASYQDGYGIIDMRPLVYTP